MEHGRRDDLQQDCESGVSTVRNDEDLPHCLERLHILLDNHKEDLANHSCTAALWLQYLYNVSTVKDFIKTE